MEHAIPTSGKLINRAEDINRYLYAYIKYSLYAICGRKADLHHVDTVGMGRNRREINHLGMRAESFCWKLHEEAHQAGQDTFDKLYYKTVCRWTKRSVRRTG